MSKPLLILRPVSGLANRLQAVAAAHVVSGRFRRRLWVDWRPQPGICPCTAENLWENTGEWQCDRAASTVTGQTAEWTRGGIDEDHLEHLLRSSEDVRVVTNRPLPSPGAEFSAMVPQMAAFLRTLRWCAEVRARLIDLPANTLGIHIRRTDHWRATARSPLHLFLDAARAHLDSGGDAVYLATDEADVRKVFRRAFGARVLWLENPEWNRETPGAIHAAAADMLHLSRCAQIAASAISSFTTVASWIGGAPRERLELTASGWPPPCWSESWMQWLRFDRQRGRWRFSKSRARGLVARAAGLCGLAWIGWRCSRFHQLGPWRHRL